MERYIAYAAPARDADGNPILVTPIDTDAAFALQYIIVLQTSEYLPCGLRFVKQPQTLSKAECAALASAVDAYWRLDGAKYRVPEIYNAKLIGPTVGPDLGVLATHGLDERICETRAPFQQQANVLTHIKRRDSNIFEAIGKILMEKMISVVVLIPLSFGYGGLHCAAWNYHFPSSTEKYLWRFSCVVFVGLIGVPLFLYHAFRQKMKLDHAAPIQIQKAINNICAGCLVLGYTALRAFIVVESFISLRSLPVGAFMMLGWLQMIPHL